MTKTAPPKGKEPGPRYPGARVSLHSDNPLVLVAAVRQELRRAGAEPMEIRSFSNQALGTGADALTVRRLAAEWIGLA